MPLNTTLRELRTDEIAKVCTWAMQENWPGLIKGQVLTQEDFLAILTLPGHLSFGLSEPGATVLGFGQTWRSPNGRMNLVRIIIDPAMRGKGIGKQLSALLLAEALRMLDVDQVYLKVRRDNAPALSVYRFLGFREIESESNAVVSVMAYARPTI